jgi:hypothetical protein
MRVTNGDTFRLCFDPQLLLLFFNEERTIRVKFLFPDGTAHSEHAQFKRIGLDKTDGKKELSLKATFQSGDRTFRLEGTVTFKDGNDTHEIVGEFRHIAA